MKFKFRLFCLLLIFFIINLNNAQTKYDDGYSNGYLKGYCYQESNCLSPNAHISPLPKINEDSNSYTDGYNRGFSDGLRKTSISNDRNGYKTSTPKFKEFSSRTSDSNSMTSLLLQAVKKKRDNESKTQQYFDTAYDEIKNYEDNGSYYIKNIKQEYLSKIEKLADNSASILKKSRGDYQSLVNMLSEIYEEFYQKVEQQ